MIEVSEFIKKISIILERPGMFGIQKVEDINLVFFSEIYINNNVELEKWCRGFSLFVINDTNESLSNFDWSKVIRLYSGSDYHSLSLFKELLNEYYMIVA